MQPPIISVSELFEIVNETMSYAFPVVVVEGEVSSYKINQGKFIFFDLKDETSTLSCFMMLYQLQMPIEDGMRIRVTGGVKVTKFSKLSLTVRSIEIAGEGQLKRAMELLRRKLEAEGLLDSSRKRPLPSMPKSIGLITSTTSAAYADFIKIVNARWGGVHIQVANVTVQGITSVNQIIGALTYFDELPSPVDVVVLIRGGGSLEDLSSFSTEPVARAVARSRTPIIVGVGHETDTSLSDLCADLRAATPSDAARIVVPDKQAIIDTLSSRQALLGHSIKHLHSAYKTRITTDLTRLTQYLKLPGQRLNHYMQRLERGLTGLNRNVKITHQGIATNLTQQDAAMRRLIIWQRQHIDAVTRVLTTASPTAVLARGYAIIRHEDRVVIDPAMVSHGSILMLQLEKGTIKASVDHGDKAQNNPV